MSTPILDIPEVANNQVNQYLTVNEAFRLLESSANDCLDIDLSSGNATISQSNFLKYFLLNCYGNNVARTVTVPQKRRLFAVRNSGSANLSVVLGSLSFVVPANSIFTFYANGYADALFVVSKSVSYSTVVNNSSSSTNASRGNAEFYTRFSHVSAAYIFNSAEGFFPGQEFHGRYVGSGVLTLSGSGGFAINPPVGGTLIIPPGGTFTVKIVASTEADLIGTTVAA